MSARDCFTAKIAKGIVSQRAGARLLDLIDAYETDAKQRLGDSAASLRKAHQAASEEALAEAARRADTINRTIVARRDVLDTVKQANDKLDALRAQGNAPIGMGKEAKSAAYAALPGPITHYYAITVTVHLMLSGPARFRPALGGFELTPGEPLETRGKPLQ